MERQSKPTSCGPASLVPILNALEVDPNIKWKGIWRWYAEENQKGLPNNLQFSPVSLYQAGELAQKNYQTAHIFHPKIEWMGVNHCQSICNITQAQKDLGTHNHEQTKIIKTSEFSESDYFPMDSDSTVVQNSQENQVLLEKPLLIKTMSLRTFTMTIQSQSKCDSSYIIANYSRQQLDQTGDGHFSPIGGFSQNSNKVLMLDTAKFKYPYYWLDVHDLYNAMFDIDEDTNQQRGLLILSKNNYNDLEDQEVSKDRVSGITKLGKSFKKIFEDWVENHSTFLKDTKIQLQFDSKEDTLGKINQFVNILPTNVLDYWIKFLIQNQGQIERTNVLASYQQSSNQSEKNFLSCYESDRNGLIEITKDYYPEYYKSLLMFLSKSLVN